MEKCQYCGKQIGDPYDYSGNFCDGILTEGENPFAVEIDNDHTLYWECEGHRYESAMDI